MAKTLLQEVVAQLEAQTVLFHSQSEHAARIVLDAVAKYISDSGCILSHGQEGPIPPFWRAHNRRCLGLAETPEEEKKPTGEDYGASVFSESEGLDDG